MINFPVTASLAHRYLVQTLTEIVSRQSQMWGLAIGGSWITDSMDFASDLDFNLVLAPAAFQKALDNAEFLARQLPHCLSFAPARHTGESRLFNALYKVDKREITAQHSCMSESGSKEIPDFIQVDFKYFSGSDFAHRVEEPVILWELDNRLSKILKTTQGSYPQADLNWIESQFWRWIYYGLSKWQRGEYIEVADHLSFLRNQVLGPLLLTQHQYAPRRVRRIEQCLPTKLMQRFASTLVRPEPWPLLWALQESASLYLLSRNSLQKQSVDPSAAETEVMAYLKTLFQPRRYLFHIATAADWQRAQDKALYWSDSLRSEGFIHLAYAHQIRGVYQRYYQGQKGLQLLKIAPEYLRAELREENLYGGQEHFPHLYGSLPLQAMIKTHELSDARASVSWPEDIPPI